MAATPAAASTGVVSATPVPPSTPLAPPTPASAPFRGEVGCEAAEDDYSYDQRAEEIWLRLVADLEVEVEERQRARVLETGMGTSFMISLRCLLRLAGLCMKRCITQTSEAYPRVTSCSLCIALDSTFYLSYITVFLIPQLSNKADFLSE